MCWLILGGRSNGLAVARAIDSPSNVYVLDFCEKKPVTAFSRYVKKVFIIDGNFQSVVSFLDAFLSENKAVLIATDDWWVHQVSRYREVTDKAFYGFFPDELLLQHILDKKSLYEILHHDVKVPIVVNPQEVIDVDDYIVKPRLSFNEGGVVEKGINNFSKYQCMGVDALIQKKITAPLESHLSICGIRIGGKILFPFFFS